MSQIDALRALIEVPGLSARPPDVVRTSLEYEAEVRVCDASGLHAWILDTACGDGRANYVATVRSVLRKRKQEDTGPAHPVCAQEWNDVYQSVAAYSEDDAHWFDGRVWETCSEELDAACTRRAKADFPHDDRRSVLPPALLFID